MPPPDHTVRLRDGDREIDVSGNPAFVRQVLDDLPVLMARLRGEAPGRTTISMPAPPAAREASAQEAAPTVVPPGDVAGNGRNSKHTPEVTATLEDRILGVLQSSTRPLAIAAIRQRLDEDVTGQQVRRLLERAKDRVAVSTERPSTYSLL